MIDNYGHLYGPEHQAYYEAEAEQYQDQMRAEHNDKIHAQIQEITEMISEAERHGDDEAISKMYKDIENLKRGLA